MELIASFKALADQTRFDLLNLLLTHNLCVGALARRLGITEAAVSQHLKQLREAGLVKGEKRGYWTHYAVDRGELSRLAQSLIDLTDLENCPDSVCVRPSRKIDCGKEGRRMCECKCRKPEKLKPEKLEVEPKGCTPAQIQECHGEEKHSCQKEK